VRNILKMSAYFFEKVWMITYELNKVNRELKRNKNLDSDKQDFIESSHILIVKDEGNFRDSKNKKENPNNNFNCNESHANEYTANNLDKNSNSNINPQQSNRIQSYFQKITYKSILFQLINFLYFYFSPTLIYRDAYPKLKYINTRNVIINFLNSLLGFLFNYFIVDMMLIPFINGNLNYLKPENILLTFINFVIFSILILFVLFFGLCHSFFNLFADVLVFADKNFYGDFWNAKTPKEFVSKIIIIINEFFEYYTTFIMKKYSNLGDTFIAWINFIFLSLVIEFIAFYSMGYFFPVTTLLMILSRVVSGLFECLKITNHSISIFFTWMFVTFGCGVLVFISLTAYYIQNDNYLDKAEICGYKFYTYFKGLC
jgi:hypothetical protein